MIERERITFDKYMEQGYDVIKAGAPDLILLKNGQISFIEVKSDRDKLSGSQERAFKLLKKHGFIAKIEIVDFLSKNLKRPVLPTFLDDMPFEDLPYRIAYLHLPTSEMLKYNGVDDYEKKRQKDEH